MRSKTWILLAAIVFSVIDLPAHAGNGLNLIGSGTNSVTMGGADIAAPQDASALNANPAAISTFNRPRLDANSGTAFALNVRHRDRFDDVGVSNDILQLLEFGYVSRYMNTPWYWGLGLFAQGGVGNEYEELNTPFGDQDELTSIIRLARLTPSIAYKVNSQWSLGAMLSLTYIDVEQSFFPNTSVRDMTGSDMDFFGTKFTGADDFGVGVKVGGHYRVNDKLALGMTYTSKTELKPEGRNFVLNLTALGLGKVNYRRLELAGIDQPQEIGLGISVKHSDKLTLALDLNWIDWSGAVRRTTLTASRPETLSAPATVAQEADQSWKDQYVLALGL